MTELVLSLFPGVGLLDRMFVAAGFCVVQAADKITGGEIRDFAGVRGRIDGVIAGPPCPGFSVANNKYRNDDDHHSVINSRECLQHTCRIITECEPEWFLIENVPCVPDVRIAGYAVQRIPITDRECGGKQLRSRHIQFGSRKGDIIRPQRVIELKRTGRKRKSVTTKTDKWTTYPKLCRLQGLDQPIKLDGWYRTAKFKAVGNGVPLRMGKILAEAVVLRARREPETDCQCDCGRSVSARALTATDACRKRKSLAHIPGPWIDIEGYHEA